MIQGRGRPGKVIVTGATGAIGTAIVRRLVGEGVEVVASGSRLEPPAELAEMAADGVAYVRCEVSEEAQVEALVAAARPLIGAVNAAGIVGDSITTAEFGADNWQRVVDVNLRGTFLCMKHEIGAMLENGGGAIVNVASIAGTVGEIERSPYVASKAGIIGMTKTAAVEYASRGVRVNVVSPGPIDTPQFHLDIGPPDSPRYRRIIDQLPLRRMGASAEIAEAVAWLLGDGSSFVIGHELVADGGLTIEGVQA